MSQIQVKNLSFYYDGSGEMVFDNVSFSVDTRWKLGLVGRNGRGKTTLLRLFMGEYEYRGTISSPEPLEYFPYPVREPQKDTQEILSELRPDMELWRLFREMELLKVGEETLSRPFSTLSRGEQAKVLLALLFSGENRFLLIDEPTNHLDAEGRKLVSRYLERKSGFILVSHDRNFLDGCIDHVMALNRDGIEVVQGNFFSWRENRERRDAFERRENEKLKKEIGRLKASAGSAGSWADASEGRKIGTGSYVDGKFIGTRSYLGEKSRKMQQRRKNLERRRERAIEEKEGLLKNEEQTEKLKIFPLSHPREELIRAEGLCLGFRNGENVRAVCRDVSFSLKKGERIVLSGRNGSGKSSVIAEILRACRAVPAFPGTDFSGSSFSGGRLPGSRFSGNSLTESIFSGNGFLETERTGKRSGGISVPERLSGEIYTAPGLKVSWVPQDASFLSGRLEEFADVCGLDRALFYAVLRKLDIPRESFSSPMEAFSAGQKKKILLAKSLCEQAHVYVWDEPLNFIDVFSRIQIEELIKDNGLTMVFAEHDRAFAEQIGAVEVRV